MQTYTTLRFPKDHRAVKWTVFAQLLLEIVQSATFTHDMVQHFTMGYSSGYIVLADVSTSWLSVPFIIGLSKDTR